MRRYLPILLMAMFMITILLGGTIYLSGHAGKADAPAKEQMTVYTTLPLAYTSLLVQEFERVRHIDVHLIPLTEQDMMARLKSRSEKPEADLILTSKAALEQARLLGFLQSHATEQTDIVPERFKDPDRYWTGIWYDPIVFAVNKEYLARAGKVPQGWDDLARDGKTRLAMTDFLAADAAAGLLFSLVMESGEPTALSYLMKIHPRIVQYAKFLSTPVRMAGIGECDVAIAVQSETLRYRADGFPLALIYPDGGTAYSLNGAGLVKHAPHPAGAELFLDWLLQPAVQQLLEEHRFFFISTNPDGKKYQDDVQKPVKLFDKGIYYTPDERHKLLDNWVQTVRLAR